MRIAARSLLDMAFAEFRIAKSMTRLVFKHAAGSGTMYRSITTGITVAVALSTSACSPGLVGANRDAYLNYRQVTQEPASAADTAPTTESAALPESPTLDDYLTVALRRNPGLRRARLEAEASGHAIAQITGLPDPQVGFVPPTGDLIQTAAGQIDSSIGISQQIPFPGKLYVRGKAAAHAAAAAREAYRSSRLQLIADVRRAYYMLYFADRAIEITSESRRLLRDFRSIAARKYEAGKVPQQDVLRAQVELANLENELLTLSRTRRTARARLNRLMSYPAAQPLPPTAPIHTKNVAITLEELLVAASAHSPDIAAARQRLGQSREAATLARLDYFPDITLGYQHTRISDDGVSPVANGDDSWQLRVGLTIPIWMERLSAGTRAANAKLEASRDALAATHDTTAFRIEESLLRVETEQRLTALFGEVILPQARQTLDATISAYRAGTVDFLTFIENWRRLLEFEISYEKSLSSFEQELAELERLVGQSVEARIGARSEGS